MATAEQIRNQSIYAERLSAVLGDGSRWEYRDECTDLGHPTGKCACGHNGLRYLFTLHNVDDGRTAVVGSVCVFGYAGITPEVVASLRESADRMEAAAAERVAKSKAALKDAANAEQISALVAEWSAIEYAADVAAQYWRDSHSQYFEPYHVYRRRCAAQRLADRQPVHPYIRMPQLKSASGIIRRLKKNIADANRILEIIRAYK